MILNPELPWKQQYQQEGKSFYLQIGLKFKEGNNERLR